MKKYRTDFHSRTDIIIREPLRQSGFVWINDESENILLLNEKQISLSDSQLSLLDVEI
jgi:hypothetical protein